MNSCAATTPDATALITESREWLSRITHLLDERLTLGQHKSVLDAAGWLTLLIGCLEYDTGQHRAAEATRQGALQLATEAANASISGWAHELRAWFALTNGRYREVIQAAQAGQDVAPGRSVSVQLLAQEAKAWARMTIQRNTIRALENGRILLESLPYPERPGGLFSDLDRRSISAAQPWSYKIHWTLLNNPPDNHFVVDPDKFDFYAMDCYRLIGDEKLAAIACPRDNQEVHCTQWSRCLTDAHSRSRTHPRRLVPNDAGRGKH